MSFKVELMSDEELEEERICENCGRSYTITEAFEEFNYAFPTHLGYSPYLTYDSVCNGEFCGSCAIDMVREQWEEEEDS